MVEIYELGEDEHRLAEALKNGDEATRELFRAACFINLERAKNFLEWSHAYLAKRRHAPEKKKFIELEMGEIEQAIIRLNMVWATGEDAMALERVLTSDMETCRNLEELRGMAMMQASALLCMFSAVTDGMLACHIIGTICSTGRSQKFFWDQAEGRPAGEKRAENQEKDVDEWHKRATDRYIYSMFQENPRVTATQVTEQTFPLIEKQAEVSRKTYYDFVCGKLKEFRAALEAAKERADVNVIRLANRPRSN